MITYNDLYEAARKERYSDQLQPLNKTFVSSVSKYLEEKKEIASRDDDGFTDLSLKTKKQLENAVTLFRELMVRRRKKILDLVLIAAETGISKRDFENMLSFEKELFEDIMNCIGVSDEKLNRLLNGGKEESMNNQLVVFKTPVEEFMGIDGGKMGPFEKGEMANIPKVVSKILVDDGKAELVKTD